MALIRRRTGVSLCLLAGFGFCLNVLDAQSEFAFFDFSSTEGLRLNGAAARFDDVLRLTPSRMDQGGSAFSTDAFELGPQATFSTQFQFRISDGGGIADPGGGRIGADGFAFLLQTRSNTVGGIGAGMGYEGISPSFAVEVDTWENSLRSGFPNVSDPNGNHIGINTNGVLRSLVAARIAPTLNDHRVYSLWVDYDGSTVEVRFSADGRRPEVPILSRELDLSRLFGGARVFAGFTSATGAAYNNHDILSWRFRSGFDPIGEPSGCVHFKFDPLCVAECDSVAIELRESNDDTTIAVRRRDGLAGLRGLDVAIELCRTFTDDPVAGFIVEPVRSGCSFCRVDRRPFRTFLRVEDTEVEIFPTGGVFAACGLRIWSQDPEDCLDPDGDDVCTLNDNCPTLFNPAQTDSDADGLGDACDDPRFVRGDTDESGVLELTDSVRILLYLFDSGVDRPIYLSCLDAADVSDDGRIDIGDAISLMGFLFLGDARPQPPFPSCGIDRTLDALSCEVESAGC